MSGGTDEFSEMSDAPEPWLDDGALAGFVDDLRRREAADARRREYWMRRRSAEEGTFSGVLIDLAERGAGVALTTAAGRVLRGTLQSLGNDFVGLGAPGGESTLIPLGAVTSLRADPDSPPSRGDRPVRVDADWTTTLTELAADQPKVSLHGLAGDRLAGVLWSVGRDLLTLRIDGPKLPTASLVYVPLTAVNDLTVS